MRSAAVAVLGLSCAASFSFAQTKLNGAGATFPAPLYKAWIEAYQKNHPDVQIDYQAKGSGAGVTGITDKTVDFAGSDAPMTKKEIEKAGGEIVQFPSAAGAVVLAYNLPGFNGELKLSGPVVADIFQSKITKWNDPKIAELNSGASLPDLQITPVERGDKSGTTFVFTSYLSTQSDDFKNNIGHDKQVQWPEGHLKGEKNDGVTSKIKDNKGAIGYIELNYAMENSVPFATLQNKDGKFVKASPESVSAAGAAATASGSSVITNIWNQSGDNSYPISSFTYLIVYKDLAYVKDEAKAKTLVDFLKWATTGGQDETGPKGYAPLDSELQKKVGETISSLTFNGQPVKS
ncbi:MAG: phosphate ABC transporter substrate-binding protein PstS [Phycisphaerae bacterium]|nr:phosphate ABC transporter substrate-binding protein PstS [Phycisphaerae bacterium]